MKQETLKKAMSLSEEIAKHQSHIEECENYGKKWIQHRDISVELLVGGGNTVQLMNLSPEELLNMDIIKSEIILKKLRAELDNLKDQ